MKRFLKKAVRKAVEFASPLLYKKFFYGHRKSSLNGKQAVVSITFDVEFERDVKALPKAVELLDSYGIDGSFACIGRLVEQFPREHALLTESGHEIVNHTYSHPSHEVLNPNEFFNRLSREKQETEIAEFERVSKRILNVVPKGFRAPHFGDLNSKEAYEILEKRGYLYSSSTVLTKTGAKGMPFFPSKSNFLKPSAANSSDSFKVLELPVMTCPKHYYSVFDSFHCYRSNPPVHPHDGEFFALFEKSLAMAMRKGLYACYYFDPSDVAGRKDFSQSLELLSSNENVWVATCEEAAEYFRKRSH